MYDVYASRGKTAPVVVHLFENTHMLHYVTGLRWGVLTFMLTYVTCTCYVTSWVGGWGVLTFMLTCVTCTCYVTSGFPLAGIIIVGCAQMLIQM